jgi:hypothetical protein
VQEDPVSAAQQDIEALPGAAPLRATPAMARISEEVPSNIDSKPQFKFLVPSLLESQADPDSGAAAINCPKGLGSSPGLPSKKRPGSAKSGSRNVRPREENPERVRQSVIQQ